MSLDPGLPKPSQHLPARSQSHRHRLSSEASEDQSSEDFTTSTASTWRLSRRNSDCGWNFCGPQDFLRTTNTKSLRRRESNQRPTRNVDPKAPIRPSLVNLIRHADYRNITSRILLKVVKTCPFGKRA
jgi:hypothetical protein